MTAEEIRKWHDDLAATELNPTEIIRARARIEIAAQLAELNGNTETWKRRALIAEDAIREYVGPLNSDFESILRMAEERLINEGVIK